MIETQAKLILDTAGNLRIQFFQYNLLHRCSTTKKLTEHLLNYMCVWGEQQALRIPVFNVFLLLL